MSEPTDEMVNLAADMLPGLDVRVAGDLHTAMRQVLTVALAIVDRDRCPERRGHVWHPLDKTPPTPPKRCGGTRWGMRCELPDGHPGNHQHIQSRTWA